MAENQRPNSIEVVNVASLEDFLNEPVKAYPYRMIDLRDDLPLVENGAASFVRIAPHPTKQKDENGNFYINLIPDIDENGEMVFPNIGTFLETLKKTVRIRALATEMPVIYEKELIIGEIGKGTNIAWGQYLYTFAEPFNAQKYVDGLQSVFFASEASSAVMDDSDNLETLLQDGYQEVEFTDIRALLNGRDNAQIFPYLGDRLINPLSPLFKPNPEMVIAYSKGIILYGDDEGRKNSPLQTIILNTPVVPMMFTPIDNTNGQLNYFQSWLDIDVVAPWDFASRAQVPTKLTSLVSDQRTKECLLDMVAIAYVYVSEFSQFERYTTGSETGRIISGRYIGYVGYPAAALEGESPTTILGNVFQKYIRDTNFSETSDKVRTLKQLIVLLSKYIGGRHSIGGIDASQNIAGANAFNEVYLPWFFELSEVRLTQGKIPNPIPGAGGEVDTLFITDDNSPIVTLRSRYFDIDNIAREINPISRHKVSDIASIQTDRKLTLPSIGGDVGVIDKLALPGEINTRTSDDLRYVVFSPTIKDEAGLQKYFGYKFLELTPNNTFTFDTDWSEFGKWPNDGAGIEAQIKEEAKRYFEKTSGTPLPSGTVLNVDNLAELLTNGGTTQTEVRTSNPDVVRIFWKPSFDPSINNITSQGGVTFAWGDYIDKYQEVPRFAPEVANIGVITNYSLRAPIEVRAKHDGWNEWAWKRLEGEWYLKEIRVPIGDGTVRETDGTFYDEDITYEITRKRYNGVRIKIVGNLVRTDFGLPNVVDRYKWGRWLRANFETTNPPVILVGVNTSEVVKRITRLQLSCLMGTEITFGGFDPALDKSTQITIPLVQRFDETFATHRFIFT